MCLCSELAQGNTRGQKGQVIFCTELEYAFFFPLDCGPTEAGFTSSLAPPSFSSSPPPGRSTTVHREKGGSKQPPNAPHFSSISVEIATGSRRSVKESSQGARKRQPWCFLSFRQGRSDVSYAEGASKGSTEAEPFLSVSWILTALILKGPPSPRLPPSSAAPLCR